jgi:hypothetical protein
MKKLKYLYEEVRVDQLWPGDFILLHSGPVRVFDIRAIEPDFLESMAGIRNRVSLDVQYVKDAKDEPRIHMWTDLVQRIKRRKSH